MQHLFSYGFALSVLLAPLLAVYSVDWAKHLLQAVAQDGRNKRSCGQLAMACLMFGVVFIMFFNVFCL